MAKTIGITAQISKYQTNKGLVELLDNLNLANVDNYAKIHSKGGENSYPSKIRMKMLDYSKGTGDKTVELNYNFSPSEIKYIFAVIKTFPKDFTYAPPQKINSHAKDANGMSKVSKASIIRQDEYNGQKKRLPWMILIENGIGKVQTTDTGGTCVASGSYQKEAYAQIMLSDYDMFALMEAADTFIDKWECAYGPALIRDGKKKLIEKITEKK